LRRTPKRIKTSGKPRNRFRETKKIWDCYSIKSELKSKSFRRNKIAKDDITNKTMIKIVMLVGNFLSGMVLMLTFFFRKLLGNMFNTMYRLKQHRKQYCHHQNSIDYDKLLFHQFKDK